MLSVVRRVKRFRERFAQAIEPGPTSSNNVTHGPTISNHNLNVNTHTGIGNIYNNNTNYVVNASAPMASDAIQAKITDTLQARHVPQAVYDAQLNSGCMDGTRVQVLRDIENWIKNPKAPQIFWLAGMAGTGKSAIAWSLCSRASADPKIILGGSFFCSRSTGLVAQRDVRSVIPTLVQLLARQSPKFSKALAEELALNPEVLHKQVTAQIKQLLYKPLLALKGSHKPVVFVIDALDECGGQMSTYESDDAESHRVVSEMLEALVTFSRSSVKLPVKFIVTSRPETHIRDTPISDVAFSEVLRLHTVNKKQVAADIRLYISKRLRSSTQLQSRFTDKDVDMLTRLCDGLFIVAATALHYTLSAGIDLAVVRFRKLLNSTQDGLGIRAAAPLDRMYALILAEAVRTEEDETVELADLQQLLAAILAARMSLSVAAMADLLDLSIYDLRASLSRLHAVVHVPDNDSELGLRTLHASFGDYLFSRAPGHIRIHDSLGDTVLARACLRLMAKRLHFNIAQSRSSYERNPGTRPDSITLSLEYACLQWSYHVVAVPEPSKLDQDINISFRPRFLFWLEVISVLSQVQRAAAMLIHVTATVKSTYLSRFLRDASSFVASSREPIETSVAHIYLSALPFAAKDSLIFKTFSPSYNGLMTVETFGIDRHGGRLIMTLTGHERGVNSIAYSSNSGLIVSGSDDSTVRVWDTRTGEEMISPLRSGDGQVVSVAIAPNGDSVASGSGEGFDVCIWSLSAGRTIPQRLSGHSDIVWSVAFSPDSSLLASGSRDGTARIWKVETSQQLAVLRKHTGDVDMVAFSSDGELLASGSRDKTIRLWHGATGKPAKIHLIQHDVSIFSVCFAPDAEKLASGCADGTIRLWEVQTGRPLAILLGHSAWIYSVQFSPDGQSLVSSASGSSVRLWNLRDNEVTPSSVALNGHTGIVRSVVFSPDGLYVSSASDDRTIRIWSADSDQATVLPLPGPDGMVHSAAISSDGAFIVSGCDDGSMRMWNAHTGDPKLPSLLGHQGSVISVIISSDGRRIASASNSESEDDAIRLWDVQTGAAAGKPLWGHKAEVSVVTFSPDVRWLAFGSDNHTVCIRNVATTQPLSFNPLQCYGAVITLTFSPDGRLLAAGDETGRIYLWHVETGERAYGLLQADDGGIWNIGFSPDSERLVSASNHEVGRVWIVSIGQQVFVLDDKVHRATFSPNGRLIGTASLSGNLGLWDAATGAHIARIRGHVEFISSIAFTPDSKSVISCSLDRTIRVWNVEAACSLFLNGSDNLFAQLATTKLREGWFYGKSNELLLWVPPEYRSYVFMSPCTMLIGSRRIAITADKDGLKSGKNWAACWCKEASTLISRVI